MKRLILTLAAAAAITFGGGTALAVPSDNSGQCPEATTIGNTPTDDGTIVLEAGLTVCIHAGNGNTGQFVTDGTSTLADYILASGLLNRGGQVPGVSNYVIYPPTPTPMPTPEVTPTPEPTPTSQPTLPPTDTVNVEYTTGGTDWLFLAMVAFVALWCLGFVAATIYEHKHRYDR